MRRHPLIGFRDGPSGRRASLVNGPDVWEVVEGLVGGDVATADRIPRAVELFALRPEQVEAALAYYAEFTDEINERIEANRVAASHDAEAAATDAFLQRLPDEDLLRAATRAGQALVTENARDCEQIARAWAATGEHHTGIIMTSPRRFRRATDAYPGQLIAALQSLMADPPHVEGDWVHWLT